MFPLKVRAKCLSMTTAANWFFNWLLAFITPYMTGTEYANLQSNIFWIWGAFCWISVIFVYFMIYETKNLTLEEVSELYGMFSRSSHLLSTTLLTVCQVLPARLGSPGRSDPRCPGQRQRPPASIAGHLLSKLAKCKITGVAVSWRRPTLRWTLATSRGCNGPRAQEGGLTCPTRSFQSSADEVIASLVYMTRPPLLSRPRRH